ncbi:MAG: four helix bundle protein [Acidobacteria bacterium]|nr:four helix bundle protein [Acidobacteriota bacterium]
MSKSLVLEKAIKFALRIVKLYRYLSDEKNEYVLSKQILISGTYVAKRAKEATQSESKQGFVNEMHIALKRASETEFWLMILHEGEFLDEKPYDSMNNDCVELIKMLTSIVKTSKENV